MNTEWSSSREVFDVNSNNLASRKLYQPATLTRLGMISISVSPKPIDRHRERPAFIADRHMYRQNHGKTLAVCDLELRIRCGHDQQ